MQIELSRMGHDVTICDSGETAIAALDRQTFDVAIIDLKMPGLSGWDVVDHLKNVSPETEFIISTGHGNMDEAISALRRGAYDFLPKPCKLFDISNVLQRVGDKLSLKNKTISLENRLEALEGTTKLIGSSPQIDGVRKLIKKIAPTDSTAMILGETGTGKELAARLIHEQSTRAAAPFVPVNCAALPESLVESELFGHRKGAFTGAETARKGLFEVANGGTLFLDELGELNKSMQVKLLRFLESGEIRRVGENESFCVDVRVVCATNRNLKEMVRDGSFREDLFFRVNTFEITLAPLRERKEDIPELARFLIARYLKRTEIPEDILSPDAVEALMEHDWTGNVRELSNALEHAMILSDGKTIFADDLPGSVTAHGDSLESGGSYRNSAYPQTLRDIEQDVIRRTLEKHSGDKPAAAAELGIALKTLYNKLNQYRIQKVAG
ncbi:MAG: sigma-54-dependent Fis family transcriptional regulator [Planctomycetes bacterium]|nr:sigma-54-dependent Fis family transcriptional regulator [Planctomycetota bacterium]